MAIVTPVEMYVDGCEAWAIAYFSDPCPQVELGTAEWRRTSFVYTTELNESHWRESEEVLDFNVAPYIASGQVKMG